MADVPYKLSLLDEADAMTKPAQNALRRIMERYHTNVRFILTVNELGKLIAPIASRCAIFRFRGLMPSQMSILLMRVCLKENKKVIPDVNNAIIAAVKGDARRALNILEATFNLENPTKEDVFALVGQIEPTHVFQLVHRAVKGRVDDTFSTMQLLLKRDGASPAAILNQIYYSVLGNRIRGLTENQRLRVLKHLGDLPYITDDIKLASVLSKMLLDENLRDRN